MSRIKGNSNYLRIWHDDAQTTTLVVDADTDVEGAPLGVKLEIGFRESSFGRLLNVDEVGAVAAWLMGWCLKQKKAAKTTHIQENSPAKDVLSLLCRNCGCVAVCCEPDSESVQKFVENFHRQHAGCTESDEQRILRSFYHEVCAVAEQTIEKSGMVSGMHWNAMKTVLSRKGIEV